MTVWVVLMVMDVLLVVDQVCRRDDAAVGCPHADGDDYGVGSSLTRDNDGVGCAEGDRGDCGGTSVSNGRWP